MARRNGLGRAVGASGLHSTVRKIEVRSPGDRWPQVIAKVAEYLNAGVPVVGVLDDDSRTAHLFFADRPGRILGPDDELTLPDLLGDFRVPVRRFFE